MERTMPVIILMICIVLTILGSTLFYVGRKLFKWLCVFLPGVNHKLFIIIPAIIALSFILSFLPLNPGIKKFFVRFNFCFVGVVLYFLLFFLLSDVVLLIGRLIKLAPFPVPQNIVKATGCIIVFCVTGITAYGIYNGRQLKQVSYTVEINKETSLDKLNVALISDTHLGHLNGEKWLAKIVNQINAMEPDIVVIAGDIFNDNFNAVQKPEESVRILRNIRSTYGVYACLGNHDGGSTYKDMLRFLEQGGVIVLQDEYAVIKDKFVILGRTESDPIGVQDIKRKELSAVLAGIDADADIRRLPVIVMDHNPANLKEYDGKVDLLLAGHTHKGQIFPANIITNLMYKGINYGYSFLYRYNTRAVITSGAGLWGPPFRIGTDNEVVKIEIIF